MPSAEPRKRGRPRRNHGERKEPGLAQAGLQSKRCSKNLLRVVAASEALANHLSAATMPKHNGPWAPCPKLCGGWRFCSQIAEKQEKTCKCGTRWPQEVLDEAAAALWHQAGWGNSARKAAKADDTRAAGEQAQYSAAERSKILLAELQQMEAKGHISFQHTMKNWRTRCPP